MKKLVLLIVLTLPTLGGAHNLSEPVNRATAKAIAATAVQVYVKLAKPVYMSDVMFRPVRGKDTVIRVDYKEQTCIGRLSAKKTYVVVPLSCVADEKYKAAKINLVFANGLPVQKTGNAVENQGKVAYIRL
ncbi:MAG: hypothetical protein J6Y17_03830 [Elusimicrobiaceae bacterium]|nr:hypothetical protein [Elusimicrobiaceae bacterium]